MVQSLSLNHDFCFTISFSFILRLHSSSQWPCRFIWCLRRCFTGSDIHPPPMDSRSNHWSNFCRWIVGASLWSQQRIDGFWTLFATWFCQCARVRIGRQRASNWTHIWLSGGNGFFRGNRRYLVECRIFAFVLALLGSSDPRKLMHICLWAFGVIALCPSRGIVDHGIFTLSPRRSNQEPQRLCDRLEPKIEATNSVAGLRELVPPALSVAVTTCHFEQHIHIDGFFDGLSTGQPTALGG